MSTPTDALGYDVPLTEEQQELKAAAHTFAAEVLRPAGTALDRMSPEAVVAPDSPLFSALKQASGLGYAKLAAPEEMGGLGLSPLESYLVLEELAWGSMGLSATLFLTSTHAGFALLSGRADLIQEFAVPFLSATDGSIIGCWAVTEPDHGSDCLTAMVPEMAVRARGQVVAHADGDEWVLNGQKSAWVSCGPIATHAMLNVHLEPDQGLDRGGVCLMPLDLPGVSRGRPLDKHGARSLPQSEIFFDNVRIPKHTMFCEADGYAAQLQLILTGFNAHVGVLTAGLARAIYETTLAYTKERVQGGKPIFEHQSVRARLFRMFTLAKAVRALSLGVFLENMRLVETGQLTEPRIHHSVSSKVFCTDATLEMATLGVQLHGGNGMTKEYSIEMLYRDATCLTIADGENHLLAQVAAAYL